MKRFLKPKYILNAVVIGLCVGITLYFFFSDDGLNSLLNNPEQNIAWQWIIVALLSEVAYLMFEAAGFYILIKDGYPDFRYIDAVKVSLMGAFWSAVTPSSTGGQPMQIYLLHSVNKVEVGYATSRLIQKFMVYQLVLMFINISSVVINFNIIRGSQNPRLVALLLALGFITQSAITGMFFMFSFSPKLSRKLIMFFAKLLNKIKIVKNVDEKIDSIDEQLESFHTGNKDIYKTPRLLIPVIILTFCQFIAMFLVTYFIYLALVPNPTANPVQIISCQAYVNLMSGMVPLPGASGAAELGFTVFFSVFFGNTLKSAALIWRFINYYGVIFITAPFAYMTKGKEEAPSAESAEPKIEEKPNA